MASRSNVKALNPSSCNHPFFKWAKLLIQLPCWLLLSLWPSHYFHQYWCLSWSPIFIFLKVGSNCRLIRLIFQWARGRFLFDHSYLILISVIASLFKPEIQIAPSRWGKERLRFVSVTSCNPVFQFISVCLSFVLFLAQRHMFLSFLV